MSPSKARANDVKGTTSTTMFCDSGHLQHERERLDMELTVTRPNEKAQSYQLVNCGTNVQSKQAHVLVQTVMEDSG